MVKFRQAFVRATAKRAATRPTSIDLFAGAGGATTGLKRAGYDVLAAVELDGDAARSFSANHPEVRVFVQDIRRVQIEALLDELRLRSGELSLLKACPPCQGFSSLGTRDSADARNDLVLEVWRFIRGLRPRVFVVENVVGLLRDQRLADVLRKARALGYGVREYVINANDFGVPQKRRRLVILGVRGIPRASLPTSLVAAAAGLRVDEGAKTVRGAFALLPLASQSDAAARFRTPAANTLARISRIPVGGNRFDLPDEFVLACHERLGRRTATSAYGQSTNPPRVRGLMIAQGYTEKANRMRRSVEKTDYAEFKTWDLVIDETRRMHLGWLEVSKKRGSRGA